MPNENKSFNFALIAIVAIVAIVALVVLINSKQESTNAYKAASLQQATRIESGNLAGGSVASDDFRLDWTCASAAEVYSSWGCHTWIGRQIGAIFDLWLSECADATNYLFKYCLPTI